MPIQYLMTVVLLFAGCSKSVNVGRDSETSTEGTDSNSATEAPGETDSDADSDTDSDIDGDTDSDTDGDSDADTETDTDTDGECPRYVTGLATGPYQLHIAANGCYEIDYLDAPCKADAECPPDGAPYCITGNCVFCRQDSECAEGNLCRGGRCVTPNDANCPAPAPCTEADCNRVSISEDPCPVCVCGGLGRDLGLNTHVPCEADGDCQILSSHPYRHCINGRCGECRIDEECSAWGCTMPGVCRQTTPPMSAFFGTWLIGWSGGLNHFSYFRFEPDGTVRRGHYSGDGAWSDDIPVFPCSPDGGFEFPLLGTWSPAVDDAGRLVFEIALNLHCHDGAGYSNSWWNVELSDDGRTATIHTLEDTIYDAARVDPGLCAPDFGECEIPPWVW